MDDVKQIIYKTIRRVAEDQSIDVNELRDHDVLVDGLGLKSLDLARILAILELQLGVDPFANRVSVTSMRTVGDLWAAYAKCIASEGEIGGSETADDVANQAVEQPTRRRIAATRQRDLRQKIKDSRA